MLRKLENLNFVSLKLDNNWMRNKNKNEICILCSAATQGRRLCKKGLMYMFSMHLSSNNTTLAIEL